MFLTTLFFTLLLLCHCFSALHFIFIFSPSFSFFPGRVMKTGNNYSITFPFALNARECLKFRSSSSFAVSFAYAYNTHICSCMCTGKIYSWNLFVFACMWKLQYRNSFIKWFFILLVILVVVSMKISLSNSNNTKSILVQFAKRTVFKSSTWPKITIIWTNMAKWKRMMREIKWLEWEWGSDAHAINTTSIQIFKFGCVCVCLCCCFFFCWSVCMFYIRIKYACASSCVA